MLKNVFMLKLKINRFNKVHRLERTEKRTYIYIYKRKMIRKSRVNRFSRLALSVL